MKGHAYTFTIESQDDALVFETRTHEDLFKIVKMMKGKMDLDEADTTAFAVGLKLFSEVMLKNKESEPFKQLLPHFKDFMKAVKKA